MTKRYAKQVRVRSAVRRLPVLILHTYTPRSPPHLAVQILSRCSPSQQPRSIANASHLTLYDVPAEIERPPVEHPLPSLCVSPADPASDWSRGAELASEVNERPPPIMFQLVHQPTVVSPRRMTAAESSGGSGI